MFPDQRVDTHITRVIELSNSRSTPIPPIFGKFLKEPPKKTSQLFATIAIYTYPYTSKTDNSSFAIGQWELTFPVSEFMGFIVSIELIVEIVNISLAAIMINQLDI